MSWLANLLDKPTLKVLATGLVGLVFLAVIGIGFLAGYMIHTGTKLHIGQTVIGTIAPGADHLGTSWTGEYKTADYGFQAWAGVKKNAGCPDGYVVTGIQVQYSGTCQRACDQDGGIIRNIVLTCRRLQADVVNLLPEN